MGEEEEEEDAARGVCSSKAGWAGRVSLMRPALCFILNFSSDRLDKFQRSNIFGEFPNPSALFLNIFLFLHILRVLCFFLTNQSYNTTHKYSTCTDGFDQCKSKILSKVLDMECIVRGH